ncbi:uncharacterized protein MYCGRDRAFT_32094 [Zymoseptoria tritici IPO323]|uniref:RBR-type E3 ubiquitin transferase n=1 Tax=Zymoseptoria tritici (strain CBS 115943 / IPO323) TaxID=336722 RepID=F9WXT8_ZYMTI|nr:uncharacterized protein MYCGRDRAFT_32094 [Zymoseptoria tritici IPO323]EGP92513.1 hypothetical protein MYCGRDRAFT_32094 [Zymoseptoria tritici IPO323]
MADIDDDVLVSLDALTIAAIVQGRLDDSNEIASGSKGKQREGTLTDAQLALQLHEEDLNACNTLLQDRMMAQSMCLAVLQDGALIDEALREEDQAARDHALAATMNGGRTVRLAIEAAPSTSSWNDPELLAKAAAIYNVERPAQKAIAATAFKDDDDTTVAESSTWAASRAAFDEPAPSECAGCGDEKEFFELARVPCNHDYCRLCLEYLFELSMKEETAFPPRCCVTQEIPLSAVRIFLSHDLAQEFDARYEELSTKVRTYCHEQSCSAFIPPADINEETGTCPQCKRTTCTICKDAYHLGDCPKDESLQLLLQAADTAQWQRCFQCGRMVDLTIGCNHMTCHCGGQFCYVCGAPWKTCECPQWEEERLIVRANEIAARHPNRRLYQPGQAAQPANAPAAIAAIAEHLLANHECDHDHWRELLGPHTCEQCSADMPNFIFECRQCHITRCLRCRDD